MKHLPIMITVFTTLAVMFFVLAAPVFCPVYGDENVPTDSAALVNDHAITRFELEREFRVYKQRLTSQGMPVTAEREADLKQQVLNNLINQELVFQASQDKGITVPPEEVDKVLAEIKQRYPDPAAFQSVLQGMQMTEDQLRAKIAQQSVIKAFIDQEIAAKIQIDDKDSKAFYDANPQYFRQPEQVHARHILIKVEAGADEKDKAKAKEKILAIRARAVGGEDFGELAKKESQGPSSSKGGDLGVFPRGRMVPAFEKAAFDLKIKEISKVVETNFGYHLIQVLDRKPDSTITYGEVKDQITARLRNQKISQQLDVYVADLHKAAKIETYIK